MTPIPYDRLKAICIERGFTSFRVAEVSREFGHDPITLDRVASEHSATICERMKKARMRVATRRNG